MIKVIDLFLDLTLLTLTYMNTGGCIQEKKAYYIFSTEDSIRSQHH
ncbi:hypothetical protein Sps_04732 [Shewanella psychrophila]|uniref:Uncharacterized protein n=1 Tax=Shewanella psychrophila TaxID=225848 RepID=A0A1S6HW78_9GAMM|nr:hypothetical protein Sps_04732 [Shewanella psychrophila]